MDYIAWIYIIHVGIYYLYPCNIININILLCIHIKKKNASNLTTHATDTVLDRIALALALMRARLSLPYKLVVALERDQSILTARRLAIRHKHRLASAPQHPYVSIANRMHTHPSSWHFSLLA